MHMKPTQPMLGILFFLPVLVSLSAPADTPRWQVDFFDDFNTFDPANWQDQMLWVNEEDQCYVPDNRHINRPRL